jgi:hypothetical protein
MAPSCFYYVCFELFDISYIGEKGEIMGLSNILREEGRQEGIQQGIQEGIRKGIQHGRYSLLVRILTHRFGPLPDWAIQQISSAPSEQLDRWADRVLEAKSIQGVMAE